MAEDQRKKHEGEEEEGEEKGRIEESTSTEYIVHNWLEALFAWFQVIVLWHEPQVSLCTISGLLSSFLLLTYFAPRFYATLLMALFIYNLNKFWFRHVWPEIRLPPGRDRELEMRADVDRFTLLHPQLMTLKELKYHLVNLTKISQYYLHKLFLLRHQKPAAFCSLLCTLFTCSAYLGSLISGLSLIFLSLIIIMSAPGIYTYLIAEEYKIELRHHLLTLLEHINQELKISQEQEHEQQQQKQVPSSGAIQLATLLDNFKIKGLQMFTSVPISINRQSAAATAPESVPESESTTPSSMLAHLKEDGAKVLYNLIDVTLMSGGGTKSGTKSAAESQQPPARRTNYDDDDDNDTDAEESEPLVRGQSDGGGGGGGGDEDDGFVILG